MQVETIFLDMDGVLANFWKSALYSIGHADKIENWPAGQYDIATVCGLTTDAFWSEIRRNSAFWINLEIYPWAVELYKYLTSIAPVTIASSPSQCSTCMNDKIWWLDNHIGRELPFMFGSQKHLLSKRGRILIDDSEDNCNKFEEHGGSAILFPRAWNKDHELTARAFSTCVARMERLLAL